MSLSIDPFRPYLPLVWLMLAIVLLFGGCSWGKSLERGAIATKMAAKDKALTAAETSLRAAAGALRAQNAANAIRIAEAGKAAKLAGVAEGIAQAQEQRGQRTADAYAKGLRDAGRKSPDCDALLKSNVLEMCGL